MTPIEDEYDFTDAVDYHYDKFPPDVLDYSRLYKPLASAMEAIARFDQVLTTLHNSEVLLSPLRSREAVISSRMEGTISTIDEVFRYDAEQIARGGHPSGFRSEVVETWLYQRALKHGQAALEKGHPISEWLIRNLHKDMLAFGRGANKSPGIFKTEQNYVADRIKKSVLFIPVRSEKLQDGLDRLFAYIEEDEQALIKTAISHVEFEALHPFQDGNGRVGRMLITLLLWNENTISAPHFYISGYFEENKDIYNESMRSVSSKNDWTGWCVFFLDALRSQALRNLEMAENIRKLYETMKSEFLDALGSKWSIDALDYIFSNPVFRNSSFVRDSTIPVPTARRFTSVLVDRGIIQTVEPASGRRAALYRFVPLLDMVRV